MGVMTMELNELWIYIGNLINQGIEWVGLNWQVIGGAVLSALGGGGILTIAVSIIKTVIPILKNTNTPVLKAIGELVESVMPKVDVLVNKTTAMESKISLLESENKTLKDYISLSAETNAKSVFLDETTKAKYQAFAIALKSVPNEVAKTAGIEIEKAISDNEITVTEALSIAKTVPIIEKALGTPISDIVSKG